MERKQKGGSIWKRDRKPPVRDRMFNYKERKQEFTAISGDRGTDSSSKCATQRFCQDDRVRKAKRRNGKTEPRGKNMIFALENPREVEGGHKGGQGMMARQRKSKRLEKRKEDPREEYFSNLQQRPGVKPQRKGIISQGRTHWEIGGSSKLN